MHWTIKVFNADHDTIGKYEAEGGSYNEACLEVEDVQNYLNTYIGFWDDLPCGGGEYYCDGSGSVLVERKITCPSCGWVATQLPVNYCMNCYRDLSMEED